MHHTLIHTWTMPQLFLPLCYTPTEKSPWKYSRKLFLSEFKRHLTNNWYQSCYLLLFRQKDGTNNLLQTTTWNERLKFGFSIGILLNLSCAMDHPFQTGEHFLLFCPNYHHIHTIIIIHSFYIALFSALEQTHGCAHVACDSEWVTATFYSAYY